MKREFFNPPKMLQEWVLPYQAALGIKVKSIQPYVSMWLSDDPGLPPSATKVFDAIHALAVRNPWLFCEPPESIDDLRPRDWWFETLALEDVIGRTTWANYNDQKRPLSDDLRAKVQERLDDYRNRLRAACTNQEWDARLLVGFTQEVEPDYSGYNRRWDGTWYVASSVDAATRHFFTREESLQEVVATMRPADARRVAVRAHALSKIEMTLIDRATATQTYSVEVTREDEDWAGEWWARVGDDLPNVPKPFLGETHVNVGERTRTGRTMVKGKEQTRTVDYRLESDFVWTGRRYQEGPSRVVAVKRGSDWLEPTEDDLLVIEHGIVWEFSHESKDELWAYWVEGNKDSSEPDSEELLRARFEKRWAEHIAPSREQEEAARAERIAEARKVAEEHAAREAMARRLRDMLPPDRDERDRVRVVRLVEEIRKGTEQT